MPDDAEPLADNPFWSFSKQVYARAGVTDACLKLQDDHGLDVNLLLFCLWCAAEGPGRLTAEDFEQLGQRVDAWQSTTIQPLRALRRQSREELDDALAAFFKAAMLRVELDAERVEQDLLLSWARERARGPDIDIPAEAARNLVVYLSRQGVSTGQVAAELRALLAAVSGDD